MKENVENINVHSKELPDKVKLNTTVLSTPYPYTGSWNEGQLKA